MSDLPVDFEKLIYHGTIKYLHDMSYQLPVNCDVLKSYYTSKFRILEERGNVYLQNGGNKNFTRCPRCCLKYSDAQTSYHIKPEAHNSRFAKKVLNKLKKKKILTKFQEEYSKKISKVDQNHLVVTCNFCNKEVSRPLEKPLKVHTQVKAVKETRRKKNKKKDKLCGLQKEAVAAVQGQTSGKTLNNQITRRKKNMTDKKNINNLNKILKQSPPNNKKRPGLQNFLQSFQ